MDLARSIVELFARSQISSDPKVWGQRAEALSALYLRLKGYRILERNWRRRGGEIDIIAEKGSTLVFVEVKARRGARFGSPEEALTPTKRKRLLTLAQIYLSSYKGKAQRVRLDVLAWRAEGRKVELKHWEGVLEHE